MLSAQNTLGIGGEPLSDGDKKILDSTRQCVTESGENERCIQELLRMQEIGKHELQWLYGHYEGFQFLSTSFLPMAILRRDYI